VATKRDVSIWRPLPIPGQYRYSSMTTIANCALILVTWRPLPIMCIYSSNDLYPQPWETECVVEEFPYKILYGDCCGKKASPDWLWIFIPLSRDLQAMIC
jgi:hypothetical protein